MIGLERAAIGDAASRGWGTHLASSLPIHRCAMHGVPRLRRSTPNTSGASLLRLAIYVSQSRSLIHAPIAGRSYSSGG